MFDAEKVTELIADYAEYRDKRVARAKPRPGDESAPDPLWLLDRAMAALSSLRDAAEDAETEWEWGWQSTHPDSGEVYVHDKSPWRQYSDGEHWLDHTLAFTERIRPSVHRVRRRAAGPWLPVPEGDQ